MERITAYVIWFSWAMKSPSPPVSQWGHSGQTLTTGVPPWRAWSYLQTANCPQAFRASYNPTSRPCLYSTGEETLLSTDCTCLARIVWWCFCSISLQSFPFVPMTLYPHGRRKMSNCGQHMWGQTKNFGIKMPWVWILDPPVLAMCIPWSQIPYMNMQHSTS